MVINENLNVVSSDCFSHSRCGVCGFCISCGDCKTSGCGFEAKNEMKFIHYATGNVITVKPIRSDKHEIVYCRELDKHFRVIRRRSHRTSLYKTSYFLMGEDRK